MTRLKIIKLTVFVLTFLLVFGSLSAIMIVYKKLAPTSHPLQDISLNQPAGSYITDYKFNNDNLYVLIKGGNTSDRIVIIDPQRQNLSATIKIY